MCDQEYITKSVQLDDPPAHGGIFYDISFWRRFGSLMPSYVARDQSTTNLYITATVVEAEQRTTDRCVLNLTNSHRIYKTSTGKHTHFVMLLPKNDAIKKFRRG